MTIRVGHNTLSFSMPSEDGKSILYEPFIVKSGVSMSANLREAFKSMDFLRQVPPRARLVIDDQVLMVPLAHYEEDESKVMFNHAFPDKEQGVLFSTVLPELNAVAVSVVNKDLKLVVDDHFQETLIMSAMTPVWNHLYRRSFTGNRQKLYAYFHEHQLDVFAFQQKGFKFCNSYEVKHMRDAVFYLLFVWNNLQLNQSEDELHLVGDIFQSNILSTAAREELLTQLHKYLQKVYIINPAADFQSALGTLSPAESQARLAELEKMPYDLQALFVRRNSQT